MPAFMDPVAALFHEGACSSTTEWDGQFIMRNNYDYSKGLLHWSLEHQVPFLYASSASVYGCGANGFRVDRRCEKPMNLYAYSKFQFDQYVRRLLPTASSQIVGFRYFNVYGPRESHKGKMASTAFHFNHQIQATGVARLFEGTDGYADGEQRRDFVYVEDCVAVNLWFMHHPENSGIYNLGTGQSQTFNQVARAVIDWHGKGEIAYIPFPEHLQGAYQSFTEADITELRSTGYDQPFHTAQEGVAKYMAWLSP